MVTLKKKVTLKTKVADVTTPSAQPIQSESQNSNLKKQENGKKWGLLIVLVAVVVIAFLLLKPGKTDNDSFVVSQTVAETVAKNTSETFVQVTEQGTSETKGNEDVVETMGNANNSENVTTENNKSKSDTDSDAKASQSQEQSLAVELFIEAIKDDLTGRQIKELKSVVAEADNDLQKARPGILAKLKEFGADVASNIVANLLTNPMIWGGL